MSRYAMKSQARLMLPVALLAAATLLSACSHHTTNSLPSTATAVGSASQMTAPHAHGSTASAMQLAAVAKPLPVSATTSISPVSTPQGSAASAAQTAAVATTSAFKEVTAGQISVTLVPTVKPVIPLYPGVQADILGVRIGMTVSQAEAVAAKTYPGKPVETKSLLSVNHGGIFAQSQPFISKVVFQNGTNDVLTADFTNPATGNVVSGIHRTITFSDSSKEPPTTSVASYLIKKYGQPVSTLSPYKWIFGDQELDVWLSAAPDTVTKIWMIDMRLDDYSLSGESTDAANKQLLLATESRQGTQVKQGVHALTPTQHTALTGTYVPAEDLTPAVQALKKDATNVLDVTGTITGHALVTDCPGGSVSATTLSRTDQNTMGIIDIPKQIVSKYGVNHVTYGDNSYKMSVLAFGNPPDTMNVDVQLDPVKGHGPRIMWGNTLVGGSVSIAAAGDHRAFTFDHAVLKLQQVDPGGPSAPPNATVTINGKAYCPSGYPPFPQQLADNKPDGSLEFVSSTEVNLLSRMGNQQAPYKVDGNQLTITGSGGSVSLKIDSDGCLDGPVKLCKK